MKAVRWTLFCLLAFGLGTGAALAVNPPSVGIPDSTAAGLASDLAAVKTAAAAGKCDSVRYRISNAQSKLNKVPTSANPSVVRQLQTSLDQVDTAATNACQQVADAKLAAEQAKQDALETPTPSTPETPTPSQEPTPTPDTSGADGAAGTSPDGATSPSGGTAPDAGVDGSAGDGSGGSGSSNGGAALPEGSLAAQLDASIEKARQRWNDGVDALRQSMNGGR